MAAIDFPASPTVGQSFTAGNGVIYVWNGTLWLASGASAGGDFAAYSSSLAITTTQATLIPPVTTGNSGGWYNVANGRFTPPAGRYAIMASVAASATAPSDLNLYLRKNGVLVQNFLDTSASNQWWANAVISTLVDANGADWFDIQGKASIGSNCAISITAYPISGIKGPPGDLPSGLKLYDEQVLAAPAVSITVTVPVACKLFEIQYEINSSGGTNDNLFLRAAVSGVPYTTANQNTQSILGVTSTPVAALSAAQQYWGLGAGLSWVGKVRGSLAPAPKTDMFMVVESGIIQQSARVAIVVECDGGPARNTVTGFILGSLTPTNLVAGSVVRSYVVV